MTEKQNDAGDHEETAADGGGDIRVSETRGFRYCFDVQEEYKE